MEGRQDREVHMSTKVRRAIKPGIKRARSTGFFFSQEPSTKFRCFRAAISTDERLSTGFELRSVKDVADFDIVTTEKSDFQFLVLRQLRIWIPKCVVEVWHNDFYSGIPRLLDRISVQK
jgi:hypothetical protein